MATALVAIIVFGILVLIHELGHFTVAKLVGIKVHEFAIGMGPKLIQVKKGETSYSIRALPLGGYVRMEGEDEKSDDLRSFNNKSVLARISVIFAGPFMNFVLAIALFSIIFYSIGAPTTRIQEVMDQSPAQTAGIQSGDIIYSINGEKMDTWQNIIDTIGKSQDNSIHITIVRNGDKIEKTVKPTRDIETNRATIGIKTTIEKSIGASIRNGFVAIKAITTGILGFLKGLITRESNAAAEIMGPVGIINLVGQVARTGWIDVVNLTAVLSVNLGLMNLLPIPALDGSRILFLLVEMLRGKPVDPEKEGMIHLIGFGLLITLMLFVTYQDILKLFS
ncbi:RIP metalloprotease RseP [Alkaliphilus sp. MSJ-5]|uniref:Zinc metalloprotease n=1 Tax=Alkaliphilus flagellatus TaxID=2841507 RepID=A0ABS6G4N0_9FIRM|nr:RIP metalloprotease RseP [Alkaliphilus flagellatus]MBU5677453.1 RIP metalloprotease RseP [Alkaliphilus flagellatus]